MKKVIYLNYQPITLKFYSDFYVGKCIESGLEAEYWDISQIYFPGLNFDVFFDFANVKKIRSFRDLKKLLVLEEIKSTIFIISITYEFRVCRLFLILSSFNCIIGFFGRGMYPMPGLKESIASKIWEVSKSFDLKRITAALKNRIAKKLKQYQIVKPYNIIFRAGSEGYITVGHGNQFDLNKSRIIDVNYFDYDKYKESIKELPIIETKYCLFIDEYIPYHPDVEITQIKTIAANSYYYELNKFFDYIEQSSDTKVIIAAHPKAEKYKYQNPFEGRTIIFNKTCELVKDAKFVMTHHSTSISFPILFRKPIIFITSESQQVIMPDLYELTFHLSSVLNSSVIHFDSYKGEDIVLKVDTDKYDDYKYKYITSKASEDRKSSDIFIETVSQL